MYQTIQHVSVWPHFSSFILSIVKKTNKQTNPKTTQPKNHKQKPQNSENNRMSSSQTLQCKTGDRWWLKLSGESHPLIPPRNAMSFNTWNWVGCTIVESLLRGSQPPQPSWTRAPATLIHWQVWRVITQELGGTACPRCVLFRKCTKLFHFYCHLKVSFR